jgi:hypothetical protein
MGIQSQNLIYIISFNFSPMGIAMATAFFFFTGARSSKISEVDAKKGLYEVDGMLWQGIYIYAFHQLFV